MSIRKLALAAAVLAGLFGFAGRSEAQMVYTAPVVSTSYYATPTYYTPAVAYTTYYTAPSYTGYVYPAGYTSYSPGYTAYSPGYTAYYPTYPGYYTSYSYPYYAGRRWWWR